MSGRVYVTGGAGFDPRRNTSKVRPVPPEALREALASLAALRKRDPALVRWIEDGHPSLTVEEHRERFGCDYSRTR